MSFADAEPAASLVAVQDGMRAMALDKPPLPHGQPDEAKLPQELVDKVIYEIRDDIPTLKQCSLVAKSWLSTTSPFLLRRVLWPPCRNKGSGCAMSLSTPSCAYTIGNKNSFELCLEILSSSPRLQNAVQELICAQPHGIRGRTDSTHSALAPITFANIVEHLPHLEVVDLGNLTLRSAFPGPSFASTGRALKKLSVSCDMDPRWLWEFFPLLSSFARVQHLALTIYDYFPSGWSSDTPASKVEVETLDCRLIQDRPSGSDSHSFGAGLVHYLDLRALRRFSCDALEPGFAGIIAAAPSLESLSLCNSSSHGGRLLAFEQIPPGLSSVDISGSFHIFQGSVGFPGTNNMWVKMWDTLRPTAALLIRTILVDFSVVFYPGVKESREEYYSYYETMLSEIVDWQTPTSVLDGFGRLESITFSIRFSVWQVGSRIYHPLPVHERHITAMQEAITNGLPPKYAGMLQVRAGDPEIKE